MTKGDIGTRTNELLAERSTDEPRSVQEISSLRENIRPHTVMQTYVADEPSWLESSSVKNYVTNNNTYQLDNRSGGQSFYGNARLDEKTGHVTPATKPSNPKPSWDRMLGGVIWKPKKKNKQIVEPNGIVLVEDNIEDYVNNHAGLSRDNVATYIQEQAKESFQAYQQRPTSTNTSAFGKTNRDVTERYSEATRQAALKGTRLG